MRKSKVKTLTGVIITLSVILLATGTSVVLLKQQVDLNKTAYEEVSAELKANTHTVYTAIAQTESGEATFLKAGTVLEEGVNVEKVSTYTSLSESAYMTEDDLGKPLINDVPDGTPILSVMVAHDEATQGDREYEVRVANMMTSQAENDLVDIRILFPNGKDYSIVTKKRVKNLNEDTASFTCLLNAEEILRMGAATIDNFTISGSYIYTVRYSEGTISEETVPTYPVRAETLELMASDPNVLTKAQNTLNAQIRLNLERSLANLSKEQVESVTSGWGLNDSSKGQIILRDSISMEDSQSVSSGETVTYTWNFESAETEDTDTENTDTEAQTEDTEE